MIQPLRHDCAVLAKVMHKTNLKAIGSNMKCSVHKIKLLICARKFCLISALFVLGKTGLGFKVCVLGNTSKTSTFLLLKIAN